MADRFEYWSNAVGTQAMPVEIDRQDDVFVTAGLTSAAIGTTQTIDGFGGNHVFERTTEKIKAGDPDALLLAFPVTGSPILEQDNRQSIVPNGGMVFFDSSRPFHGVMQEPFRWQLIAIPKSVLQLSDTQSQKITAVPLSGTAGLGRVIKTVVTHIISQSAELDDESEAAAVGTHATDLISTLIRSAFAENTTVTNKTAVLRESVLAFIRTHHGNPTLTPTMIAAAHHISLRTLHGAFTGTGNTLMDTVRQIRTRAARGDLSNPYFSQWSISQIAAVHGFPTPTDFSRSFRTSYNTTPTEYRHATRLTAQTTVLTAQRAPPA